MKKLILLLLLNFPLIVLNARQQQNHNVKTDIIPTDTIFVTKADTSYTTFKSPLQFTSFIQLKVHGLAYLIQQASEKKKSINLFLDGIEMNGIVPIGRDKSKEVLFFVLHRDSLTMQKWQVVRRIVLEKKKKELLVSVGLNGEKAYPSTFQIPVELSRSGDYYLAFLSYTFAIILFSFLLKRSKMLQKSRKISTDAYSLSKTIVAFWIFIILFSMIFVLAATNSMPHITNSAIVLLIISSVTTLIALNFESDKHYTSTRNPVNSGFDFFREIISDSRGISIFRVQLLLFSTLTGIYFIITVISEMHFPVLEISYLILFGISHLIYLSFKWLEYKGRL
jgi:hypothetical protein